MRDHTKLRAFELADEIAMLVYQQTRRFPKEEVYGMTSQMRRAAVSVLSNFVGNFVGSFVDKAPDKVSSKDAMQMRRISQRNSLTA